MTNLWFPVRENWTAVRVVTPEILIPTLTLINELICKIHIQSIDIWLSLAPYITMVAIESS